MEFTWSQAAMFGVYLLTSLWGLARWLRDGKKTTE